MENSIKHIAYQITNNINGKFYIGKHSTENVDDDYLGSGIALKRAVKKYGKENFTKNILGIFDSEEKAYYLEEELLAGNWNNLFCYNASGGGKGAGGGENHPLYGKSPSKDTRKKISEALKGEKNHNYGKHHSEDLRKKMSAAQKGKTHSEEAKKKMSRAKAGKNHPLYGKTGKDSPMYGKTHSEETKKKISGAQSGKNCYWYGKTHSEETKKKMSKLVYQYNKQTGEYLNKYYSVREAARITGVYQSSISRCCLGQGKSAGGYVWSYIKQENIKTL